MTLISRLAQTVSRNRAFRRMALFARDTKQSNARARLQDLNAFERRVYSQNGEDGIIAELFARIPNNRFFVEIGVEDGRQCNSALLARHYGWQGIMIEADDDCFKQLEENYSGLERIKCLKLLVDRDNIAQALETHGVPRCLDLLCIDIDGNDYYVWEALRNYRASVVVIEYNATLGREASRAIAYNARHAWQRTQYFGASLGALAGLGNRLGYELVGTDRRGINAFFVRRDLLELSGFPGRTPREAWRSNRLLSLLPKGSGDIVDPEDRR